jgi:signal transduction histidine kinase
MDSAPEVEWPELKALVDHSSDPLGAAHLDGRVLFLNHAASELLQLDGPSTALTISDLVPSRYQPTVRHQILPMVARNGRWEGEIPFRQFRSDGQTLVLWSVFLITEPSTKHPRAFGWVARTRTQRHQLQESLRDREHDLRRLLQERKLLFEDLHDNVIQMLYAAGMQLEAARRLVRNGGHELREHLDVIRGRLNDVIRDIRGYFVLDTDLGPVSGETLIVELHALADALGRAHLVEFTLDLDPSAAHALTSEQASHILAISREAVGNSIQHGAATRVTIALTESRQHVNLHIRDDGMGFDLETSIGRGRGLLNMKTRAETLGAPLGIVSHPGRGTEVELSVPKEPAGGDTR